MCKNICLEYDQNYFLIPNVCKYCTFTEAKCYTVISGQIEIMRMNEIMRMIVTKIARGLKTRLKAYYFSANARKLRGNKLET